MKKGSVINLCSVIVILLFLQASCTAISAVELPVSVSEVNGSPGVIYSQAESADGVEQCIIIAQNSDSLKYRLKVIHFAPVKVYVEINGRAAGIYDGNKELDVSDYINHGINRVKITIEKNGECRIASSDSLEVTISRKDGAQYTHVVKARFLGDALQHFPDSRLIRYTFSEV
ncbi:MAG: hypothetical protein AB2L14_26425 [Candidatus Xenobiia bacterium LiM19]